MAVRIASRAAGKRRWRLGSLPGRPGNEDGHPDRCPATREDKNRSGKPKKGSGTQKSGSGTFVGRRKPKNPLGPPENPFGQGKRGSSRDKGLRAMCPTCG